MTDPLEAALRTMLHERSADITDVSSAVLDLDHPRPHRPSRASHRSWFLVAASIVTVLAVAAAVAGIQRLTRHRSVAGPTSAVTAPTTPGPPGASSSNAGLLQWSFSIAAPDGYQLLDRAIAPKFQTASLRLVDDPDASGCCGGLPHTVFVTVYSPSAYDDRGATSGTRVDVGHVQGYYGVRPAGLADAETPISDKPLPTVSWQYAPDAWATVQATTPTTQQPQQLRRVAAAVRPGATGVVRTPVRLGYVPAGLEVAQRTDDLVETSGTRLSLTDGALGAETTTELSVQVWPDPGPHEDLGAATTVGGRSGRLLASGDGASVVIGQREVVITLDGPRASRTELTRIAGAVQWASNPGDPTAWFDARTSVP